MRRAGVRSALVVLLGTTACGGKDPERLLEDAIRATAGAETVEFQRDTGALGWMANFRSDSAASGALPGATYFWATYYAGEHSRVSAIAMSLEGELQLLQGPADWGRVAGAREITGAAGAADACAEIVRYAGPRSDPFNFPVVHHPGEPLDVPVLNPIGLDSARASWRAPEVRRSVDGWIVELWVMEMARSARYSCHLASPLSAFPPALTLVDSIEWGLFADEH